MNFCKTIIRRLNFVLLSFFPSVSFGAILCGTAPSTTGIAAVNVLVQKISDVILKPLIFLMFALATLVFFWGAKNFVGAADDAEARAKGAQQMIWGIVGAVIMISAVALVTIICNTAVVL